LAGFWSTRGFSISVRGEDEDLYLSSADWMNRNMVRRVELAWPVTDPVQRQRWLTNVWWPTCTMAWTPGIWGLTARYRRFQGDGKTPLHGAQAALMARYADVEKA
jgi:polyphosphate kinase